MPVELSDHLLVPFAGTADEPAQQALRATPLPHLQGLLDRTGLQHEDRGDALAFNPPHERALARALGLTVDDASLPWAALESTSPGTPQAWVHPVHFQVGMDTVSLTPVSADDLEPEAARALFDALAPLCAQDGVALTFDRPTRWRAGGERLRGLRCASLDRVAGRSVAAWQPTGAESPWLRRLQNEAQMLFYTHPVNDAREAARRLPVNGVWFSAAGAVPPGTATAVRPVQHLDLRAAALRADTTAWVAAWRALDAGPLAEALQRVQAGADLTFTLCGEQHALTFSTRARPRGLLQRLARATGLAPMPRAHDLLASL